MKYFIFLLLLVFSVSSNAQDSAWIKSHYYKSERYITMRDGIRLFTSMYIPLDSTEKHPILLTRTPYSCAPYGENNWRSWWNRFQREYFKEGYIMITQDMRGRYMSEGEFHIIPPYIKNKKSKTDIDEASDTYDAIDWLVKNVPGNNGKVGVVGISYPGFAATEASLSGHPALMAVSPQAPTTDAFMGDDVHHNGAFFLQDTYGFLVEFGIGIPRQGPTTENAVGIPPFTADAYDFYLRMGALSNMTKIAVKNNIQIWGELMQHPDYDTWWKAHNTREGLYNVKPAMMEVGGLFDAEDCFGAWNVYKAIEKHKMSRDKLMAEEELKSSYQQLRQLASHLQDIREEERASMAREIHDELGQQLTGLKLEMSWLSLKLENAEKEIKQKIEEISGLLANTIGTVRKIATELRPRVLDDYGLVEAIKWLNIEYEKRTGIAIQFQSTPDDILLSDNLAIALFRIYQESLTNIMRHAAATTVSSLIEINKEQLTLTVSDNGKGFAPKAIGSKKTLGLLGMKERTSMLGGTFEIISEPGNGTKLLITFPFNKSLS